MIQTYAVVAAVLILPGFSLAAERIEFNRDVRPILSNNCFVCHGPDKNNRQAELRLDIRHDALTKQAFVPGDSQQSELIVRIHSEQADQQMPPPDSNKQLTVREREILKLWIEQGAEYQAHWSYEKPIKATIPVGQNGVDVLVRKQLDERGLQPSSSTDRRTLIRRLYADLLGLPPNPREVTQFTDDPDPTAYARLVERTLESPHYGERMAIHWLDVVRFADTIGYHSDNPRNVWPYRDWVIQAFNENKRFDRFTLEQIAGDLLPDANQQTRVGSAFNRLLLSTEEGGAQAKDYEQRMLTDRVRAIGTAWLGQTTGCCQCHDHKFDPFTMRDFYSLGAFFADIKEPILGRREDGMMVLKVEDEKKRVEIVSRLAQLQSQFDQPRPDLVESQYQWERAAIDAYKTNQSWKVIRPVDATTQKRNINLSVSAESIVEAGIDAKRNVRQQNDGTDVYSITFKNIDQGVTGFRIESLKGKGAGIGLSAANSFVLSEINLSRSDDSQIRIRSASATFEQSSFPASTTIDQIADRPDNGWSVLGGTGADQGLYLELAEPIGSPVASLTFILHFSAGENQEIANLRFSSTTLPSPIRAPRAAIPTKKVFGYLQVPVDGRSPDQIKELEVAFKQVAPDLNELREQISRVEKEKADFDLGAPKCLVSVSDSNKRTVRILPRGNWMDESGEIVKPALPHFLLLPTPEERELTRLDLAQWLVSRDNPLTARTVMNRLWKQLFGIGLSKVLDDLGAQGEPPVNAALLDWLACEFMDSGWDMKHMVRTIVNSATYQQSSVASAAQIAADPQNRHVARQSPFRLDAELVRDNALAISGLLVRQIGGPSVKPYQPEGYWENLNFPQRTYPNDTGQSQYRRGLYTWWQRSFMHPSLLAFDAPNREECCAERNRSNIPQQALVLLNDPTYVEAARVFAARVLVDCSGDDTARIKWAWQQALQRAPTDDEIRTIDAVLKQRLAEYRSLPSAANEILRVGYAASPPGLDSAQHAAWTHVARILLNLHETVTRS